MELNRTAVNQAPHGGSDYPFAARSDVSGLLLDFYLIYGDDAAEFQLPFRLFWLHGCGTVPAAPPAGAPAATHAYDLVVVDADDQVVFDSTGGTVLTTDWGDHRRVVEWRRGDACCRIVYDTARAGEFGDDLTTDVALDARTYVRTPRRLRSLTVNDQRLTGAIKILAGFNTTLTRLPGSRVDGGRFREVVEVACAPGTGAGRSPGCEEELPVLRSVNGQTADAGGNLVLSADSCWRVQYVTSAGAYADESARSALLLDDDCTPCCPCAHFVRTYKGLRLMHSRWLAAAQELESIRDLYHANRARWLAQRECRLNDSLKVHAASEDGCTVAFAISYCNNSFGCVQPVEIRLNAELYDDGELVEPPDDAFACAQAFIRDSSRRVEEPLTMGGAWPSFVATMPFLNQQAAGTLRFRLCLRGCSDTMSLVATVSAHSPEPTVGRGEVVELPVLGDGSEYGSAYTTRGIVELTRPLRTGNAAADCGCA